jgi:hypothetical protein
VSHSGAGATVVPTLCPQRAPINDVGLTDAQRAQLYHSAAEQGWQCYGAWIANLNPSTLPYGLLGHSGMQARCPLPGGNTLSEAKANAAVILSGTVQSLSPVTTGFGTKVAISVTQVLKGQGSNPIIIGQGSHLEPLDDAALLTSRWQGVLIVDMDCAPLLLPGESVFLFLEASPEGLHQESWTGTYYVRDGKIQALPFNPFASQVNGQSPAGFATAITNA